MLSWKNALKKEITGYLIFSLGLFLWTITSVHNAPLSSYAIAILLMAAAAFTVFIFSGERIALIIILFFINIGLSIAYRCGETAAYNSDLILMLIVFAAVYLLIRFTRLYQNREVNILIVAVLLLVLPGARMFGNEIFGSYIYFAGFMVFGWILMLFPFAAAYFMSMKEANYLGGNVKKISGDMMAFLFICFAIYGGCKLCNEYGVLLITGVTSTILFLIRCKSYRAKIFYSVSCMAAVLFVALTVPHIRNRIRIWLWPADAYQNDGLRAQAESTLYLFRHLKLAGFWGNGIGNLSEAIYPTLNTDHALVLLINDYSVFLLTAVLILAVIFGRWMLKPGKEMCTYDRFLNLACGLIVILIILIDVASNLGSFITAGIGFPWISEGGSSNVMLSCLTAIHCGILDKGGKSFDQKK